MVNTHVYLGYTLDRELRHRKHIEAVTSKASKKLPLLKLLAGKNNGANPATLVKIGNALIRSRLDYGASIYGGAAETNLQKVQTIQNSMLRTAMGYIKSTPIHVMLSETGQMPMKIRGEWLAKREIVKSVYHQNQLAGFIQKTIDREQHNGSFLTQMADKHIEVIMQIHLKDTNIAGVMGTQYIRSIGLEGKVRQQLIKHQHKKTNIPKEVWQKAYLQAVSTDYKGFKRIFTDGSRNKNGTAIAVYDEHSDTHRSDKVNANVSITNAELMAMQAALEWAIEEKYEEAVILTDSASACAMLKNRNELTNNYVAWNIYKLLQKRECKSFKIQWIPSHTGIQGNERADGEAVARTAGRQSVFNCLTLDDALVLAKNETWEEWSRSFEETSQEKGMWYKSIQPTPLKKVWFKNLALSNRDIKTLSRIRTGHTLTKERKAKWRRETTDECDYCGETEDLQHLLYMCLKYNNIRYKFPALEYCKPLEDILKEKCEASMTQIACFIKNCKIQI